jgi:hypothetical protein
MPGVTGDLVSSVTGRTSLSSIEEWSGNGVSEVGRSWRPKVIDRPYVIDPPADENVTRNQLTIQLARM